MTSFSMLFISSIVSATIFFVIFYYGFRRNRKKTEKRVLLKISYTLLCIVISFLITRYFIDYMILFDLEKIGFTIAFNENEYRTILDFLEDFVVYNSAFLQLYEYFPNFKDLFMEVPHLLFTPFAFVIVFLLSYIIFWPLYFLSTKVKVYDETNNRVKAKKSDTFISGLFGGIHAILFVSILLIPINGINRAYHASLDTQISENSSLCQQLESLYNNKEVCSGFEIYNSTIFAKIGGQNSFDQFIYRNITYTETKNGLSMEDEFTQILKTAIILEQTGLIYLNEGAFSSSNPVQSLNFNHLNEETMDVLFDTITQSRFTSGIFEELYVFLVEQINNGMSNLAYSNNIYDFSPIDLTLLEDEIEREISIILSALSKVDKMGVFELIQLGAIHNDPIEIIKHIDLDAFDTLLDTIFESRTFITFVPPLINILFNDLGLELKGERYDDFRLESKILHNSVSIIQKYETFDFMELLINIEDEDRKVVATILRDMMNSEMMLDTIDVLFDGIRDYIDISSELLFKVVDWEVEVDVLVETVRLLNAYQSDEESVKLRQIYNVIKGFGSSQIAFDITQALVRENIIN